MKKYYLNLLNQTVKIISPNKDKITIHHLKDDTKSTTTNYSLGYPSHEISKEEYKSLLNLLQGEKYGNL